MKSSKPLSLTLLLAVFVSTSCSKDAVQPSSSSAGALTANSAISVPARPFEKRSLTGSGYHFMNEFIRPDVRSRMDEEPVGDADSSYDPAASAPATSEEPQQGESVSEEPAPAEAPPGEEITVGSGSDTIRYSWATKAFGEAVKSSVGSSGYIVLYADEDYFDINALMAFVEEGRNRIAEKAGIGGEKIQVVFGGYRPTPQVEMWVMPDGSVPELRPDERHKPNQPED